MNGISVPLADLNIILGTVKDAYNLLSEKYYLPKITSKAISRPYLSKILLINEDIILRVPRDILRKKYRVSGELCP